jgi:hypothetical protein
VIRTRGAGGRTRQVTIWLANEDVAFLRELADEHDQSVSAFLRRQIAAWRKRRLDAESSVEQQTASARAPRYQLGTKS